LILMNKIKWLRMNCTIRVQCTTADPVLVRIAD
jgi:hypothetical protein